MKKLRILMVAHYYPPHLGGLEVVVERHAQSVVEGGDEAVVLTTATQTETTDEHGVCVLRKRSIHFFDNAFKIPFPIVGPGYIRTLLQEAKKADIIHVHDVFYMTSWLAALAAWWYQKPLHLTQHVGIVHHPNAVVMLIQRSVYSFWGTLLFKQARFIVAYNDIVKGFLVAQGVPQEKILLMRNGIDTNVFVPDAHSKKVYRRELGIPEDAFIALFVGRLVPKKGFALLMEAADDRYHLVFAGSPVPESTNEHMTFLGPVSRDVLPKVYAAADAFVLPAQGELFTVAMQEAMSAGLPVITTNEPEYHASDLDTSLVRLLERDVPSIKDALRELAENPELCARMGAYGREYALNHFDWSKNFIPLKRVYDSYRLKPVLVTTSWDDGHAEDIRLAKLLRAYGIAGTFYVSPKDREFKPEELLTDAEIVQLSRDFEIGAHTVTHPHLTKISESDARFEITESKAMLEKVLGKPVVSFCYPAGFYNSTHMRMAQDAGFLLARTVARFSYAAENRFAMPTTIHAYRHWSDAWPILKTVGLRKFLAAYLNWDVLAKHHFDHVLKTGGVFHLWGHSWELTQNGDWERLENVLRSIAHKDGVEYVPNKDLVLRNAYE